MHLFRRRKDDADVRFKVFRYGEPMMLSAVLPVLHSLGVRVQDERPYEMRRADGTVYIYDFGLHPAAPAPGSIAEVRAAGGERVRGHLARRGRGGPASTSWCCGPG